VEERFRSAAESKSDAAALVQVIVNCQQLNRPIPAWVPKVAAQDTHNGLFIIEQVCQRKGGPPRHLHHAQEEWFYIMEGEYVFEVGEQRMRMRPGDSLIGPRGVPHVWAYVGESPGKIMIGFAPAGQMEKFFIEAAKLRDFAADQKLYRECGMDIVGPPLPLT
jgi:quercetin 2,3-dioxygenase